MREVFRRQTVVAKAVLLVCCVMGREDAFSKWYDVPNEVAFAKHQPLRYMANNSAFCSKWVCQKGEDCPNFQRAINLSAAGKIPDFPNMRCKPSLPDSRFAADDATPPTSLKCRDSQRCGASGCSSPDCDFCIMCRSDLASRVCEYENLYYDGGRDEFLILSNNTAFDTSGCHAMVGHGTGRWRPRVVSELPRRRLRHAFKSPVILTAPLHGAFAHGFLEGLLNLFWVSAEIDGEWAQKTPWTVLFEGPVLRLRKANFRKFFEVCGGAAQNNWQKNWFSKVAERGALYPGIPILKNRGLVRFERVVASGFGGRTPWNGQSYASSRSLGSSDFEFSRREHATATMHFFDRLKSATITTHQRPKKLIVFLNREKLYSRNIANVPAVVEALRLAFPRFEVRSLNPSGLENYPRDLVALLDETSLLISPHGAQLAHVGFMPPGGAVLEIQPLKCDWNDVYPTDPHARSPVPMYEYLARYAGLDYGRVNANSGEFCACKRCELLVEPEVVVSAARLLLGDAETFAGSRKATLLALWDRHPRDPKKISVQTCDI